MRGEPDGMLGAIVASEALGITDTIVNGSGGCRSRTQVMLHEFLPDYEAEDPERCRSKYFSRQSRLPCTFINNDDIVFGTGAKVSEGVDTVSASTGRSAVLVETLGASLLCTDYSGLTGSAGLDPVLIEGDLSGMSFRQGFDRCTSAILERFATDGGEEAVNILGYGIQDPGWGAGARNLESLFALMGLRTRFVSCRRPDKAVQCGSSQLNVMLRPELCRRTAGMLGSRFGIPSLRPSAGAPVGYDATRSLIREVAEATGADPTRALDAVDSEAGAVHRVLMNFDRDAATQHAKGLVIEVDSSTAWPLLRWMHGTFGMAPRRIVLADDEYLPEISAYLEEWGFDDVIGKENVDADVVFTDGMSALEGRSDGTPTSYVEVRMPRGRHLDLMGRCVVGTEGCRYLLDEMMNGVGRFRCGQPTEVEFRP